ncbi:Tryptophan synthase alpha chain [Nocardia otitidiscaviarum]|uniref:tryptophan synthase n=1 Tax=Nocardia otitidiscaviarum TaxID=1823 RepID=A0A378YTM7_9NOCA|nr:tryptophan synthase subunit alpha [Nocardia otitidiscaviarum]SUA80526.1 Tryptophan synthase alpha chain [Nocardia otitidiscaviarum]
MRIWTAEALVATVFMVAPNTTTERLREITAVGTGFVYAAGLMGVTGSGGSLGDTAADLVRRIRTITDLPVCVGIGITNAARAAAVASYADGVVVGAALVRAALDAPDASAGRAVVRELVRELAEGVRG